MSEALYLPARAKLNLTLRVVGRRADGYHLLDTVFHTLQLHDDLGVERRDSGVRLTVTADAPQHLVPATDDNLVVRALAALQREVGDRGGFCVRLHKRIPNGGGLGGGSSDAAAALRLGNAMLGEPLDLVALARLAVGLGADVPFFLRGGTQRGRGIGDELTAAPAVARHFVLLVPPFGCETVAVYKNHAALWQGEGGADTVRAITVPDNRDAVVGMGYGNDLQQAAEQLRPELGRLRAQVSTAGFPQVRMSGSGSTLFVACDDAQAAGDCRRVLQEALTGQPAVELVVTESGPAIDADHPSAQLPATVSEDPPDRGVSI